MTSRGLSLCGRCPQPGRISSSAMPPAPPPEMNSVNARDPYDRVRVTYWSVPDKLIDFRIGIVYTSLVVKIYIWFHNP